jgi:hypothetical protein
LDAYRDSNISESLNKHRAMSTLIFKVWWFFSVSLTRETRLG